MNVFFASLPAEGAMGLVWALLGVILKMATKNKQVNDLIALRMFLIISVRSN